MERHQSASATRVAGVAELSRQPGGLASRKAGPEAAQAVLGAERQRLQHLLAVSPAIIYSTKASGDFACTFVSENIRTIMGFSGSEMIEDPEFWLKRLHPNDVKTLFDRMAPLIEAGSGAIEYPLPASRRPLRMDSGHVQGGAGRDG